MPNQDQSSTFNWSQRDHSSFQLVHIYRPSTIHTVKRATLQPLRHRRNSHTPPFRIIIIPTRRPLRTTTATTINQHYKVQLAATQPTTWHISDPMACNWSTDHWILVWTPTNICHCKMKIARTRFNVRSPSENQSTNNNKSDDLFLHFAWDVFVISMRTLFIVSVLFIENNYVKKKKILFNFSIAFTTIDWHRTAMFTYYYYIFQGSALEKIVPQIERQSKIEDNLLCAEHTGDANVRRIVDRKSINNAKWK